MAHQYHFFLKPEHIQENFYVLEGEEFRHCCRVLRKNQGETISLRDGRGFEYLALIKQLHRSSAILEIKERRKIEQFILPIHIGIGLIKGQKLDYLVHRLVELGVVTISLIRMDESVKEGVKSKRLEKIAIEAFKQSGGVLLPEINQFVGLREWLKTVPLESIRIMADLEGEKKLAALFKEFRNSSIIAILVGPEGGISVRERELLIQNGFTGVKISPRRLMTETAAIAITSMLYGIIGQEIRGVI